MNSEGSNFSYERILSVIVIILCAFIVGYNVFYKPSLEVIEFSSVPVINSTITYNIDDSDVEHIDNNESFNDFDGVIQDGDLSENITYPININTATADELSNGLEGIGEVMSSRIISYREEIGGFSSIEQLMDVSGIGETKFNNIKNYVTVE